MAVIRGAKVLYPSAARSASQVGEDQVSPDDASYVIIHFRFETQAGVETLTPVFQIKNEQTNLYKDWVVAFTALSATGHYHLVVGPQPDGVDYAGDIQLRQVVLPGTWRLNVTHSSTGAQTYSVWSEYVG